MSNAKILALVIGHEKHWYQPKKKLSIKLRSNYFTRKSIALLANAEELNILCFAIS